ncbi:hypothetical protein KFE25_007815 [Diacronema lutheri]|uniref:Sfi1 spindle body domain-containing protein n=1 Tax=Diacronema lutheri TaxID=2081491 RepID=A0A8J6CBY1_DIALT|nr:hypothetical protein KFE25_007815 [Diacronema lutheri]
MDTFAVLPASLAAGEEAHIASTLTARQLLRAWSSADAPAQQSSSDDPLGPSLGRACEGMTCERNKGGGAPSRWRAHFGREGASAPHGHALALSDSAFCQPTRSSAHRTRSHADRAPIPPARRPSPAASPRSAGRCARVDGAAAPPAVAARAAGCEPAPSCVAVHAAKFAAVRRDRKRRQLQIQLGAHCDPPNGGGGGGGAPTGDAHAAGAHPAAFERARSAAPVRATAPRAAPTRAAAVGTCSAAPPTDADLEAARTELLAEQRRVDEARAQRLRAQERAAERAQLVAQLAELQQERALLEASAARAPRAAASARAGEVAHVRARAQLRRVLLAWHTGAVARPAQMATHVARALESARLFRALRGWRRVAIVDRLEREAAAFHGAAARTRAAERLAAQWRDTRLIRVAWAGLVAARAIGAAEAESAAARIARARQLSLFEAALASGATGAATAGAATVAVAIECAGAGSHAATPCARDREGAAGPPARPALATRNHGSGKASEVQEGVRQEDVTPEPPAAVSRTGQPAKAGAASSERHAAARALLPRAASALATGAAARSGGAPGVPGAAPRSTSFAISQRALPPSLVSDSRASNSYTLGISPQLAASRLVARRAAAAERAAAAVARRGGAGDAAAVAVAAAAFDTDRRRAEAMEARARDRAERRAALDARYAERAAAAEGARAEKRAAELAVAEDDKLRAAEADKATAIQRAHAEFRRRLRLEQLELSRLHALRQLVLHYGIRPWQRALRAARSRAAGAEALWRATLGGGCLRAWAMAARRTRAHRCMRAWASGRTVALRARGAACRTALRAFSLLRVERLARERRAVAAARRSCARVAMRGLACNVHAELAARAATADELARRLDRARALRRWAAWLQGRQLARSVEQYRARLWAQVHTFLADEPRVSGPSSSAAEPRAHDVRVCAGACPLGPPPHGGDVQALGTAERLAGPPHGARPPTDQSGDEEAADFVDAALAALRTAAYRPRLNTP